MVYEGHASAGGTRQLSDAWYRLPIFYFSNPLCIFGPEDAVPYPSASEQLDYELELAAVIGREASNVAEADAFSYIAGFTIFNDWSCRDLQRDEMEARLGPAKGKDSASSLGPWIVTTDELASFIRDGRLHVRCTLKVNGVQWMDNNAGIMYHTWGAMIERASRDSRVVPGDILVVARLPAARSARRYATDSQRAISNMGTSWRSRLKGSAFCATLSRQR